MLWEGRGGSVWQLVDDAVGGFVSWSTLPKAGPGLDDRKPSTCQSNVLSSCGACRNHVEIVIGISDCLSGCEQTDDTVLLAHAKKSNATFSTNDKVYVDGGLFAEGSSLNAGCHGQAASSIKVCGCGVKVVAHMLPACLRTRSLTRRWQVRLRHTRL
ncbi:unnamed protein product [Symbiodinium natans]|uniref:Uncharacterized protein n=1 Tax=Symbiodinium natans TaxID=878477 RepID=A0A812L8B7_9DINO|nr:unnamed protein product [Symbiodinium natans]